MEDFLNSMSDFFNKNGLSIVLVSLIFSLWATFLIVYDIQFKDKKYKTDKELLIEVKRKKKRNKKRSDIVFDNIGDFENNLADYNEFNKKKEK